MIIRIDGDINRYYIQTLCMLFFPGASFPEDEEPAPGVPELSMSLKKTDTGWTAVTDVSLDGKNAHAERSRQSGADISEERCKKLAVGDSVVSALGELMEYRPSWGVLTGVRPSKVATEFLNSGTSKTRTKKILTHDYLVIPKKADLAVAVLRPFLGAVAQHGGQRFGGEAQEVEAGEQQVVAVEDVRLQALAVGEES